MNTTFERVTVVTETYPNAGTHGETLVQSYCFVTNESLGDHILYNRDYVDAGTNAEQLAAAKVVSENKLKATFFELVAQDASLQLRSTLA